MKFDFLHTDILFPCEGTFLPLVKGSQTLQRTACGQVLWGFAPNPTHFLKKASQKLLFAFGGNSLVLAKTKFLPIGVKGNDSPCGV